MRSIADRLYGAGPVDEPGNDDLGALSSWYVWAAVGLYPVTPGTADLALASPLFPEVVITLPDARQLVLSAPGASATTPYIQGLTASGVRPPRPASSCPGPVRRDAERPSPSWDQAVAPRLGDPHRR